MANRRGFSSLFSGEPTYVVRCQSVVQMLVVVVAVAVVGAVAVAGAVVGAGAGLRSGGLWRRRVAIPACSAQTPGRVM